MEKINLEIDGVPVYLHHCDILERTWEAMDRPHVLFEVQSIGNIRVYEDPKYLSLFALEQFADGTWLMHARGNNMLMFTGGVCSKCLYLNPHHYGLEHRSVLYIGSRR